MIYIWPDGDWCWASDGMYYGHKSDDYLRVEVPEWTDDYEADLLAQHVQKHGTLPENLDGFWGISG